MKRANILLLASIALLAPATSRAQAADSGPSWSQQFDRCSENLKAKLAEANSRLDSLKAKVEANAQQAGEELRAHLDQLRARIEQDRAKVEAAQADVKAWIESHKNETAAKIAEWKTKHEVSALENRAERAERYAAATADAASAAIDEAEWAAVEALLARQDANGARAKSVDAR